MDSRSRSFWDAKALFLETEREREREREREKENVSERGKHVKNTDYEQSISILGSN